MKSIQDTIDSLGLTGKKFSGVINKQIAKYEKLVSQAKAVEAEVADFNEEEMADYENFIAYVDSYHNEVAEKLAKIAQRESQKSASAPKVPKPAEQPQVEAPKEDKPKVEEPTIEDAVGDELNNTPAVEDEKKGGSGLGTIFLGGLVLLTTFGAYNYFKRR